jgi:hypothetical protein
LYTDNKQIKLSIPVDDDFTLSYLDSYIVAIDALPKNHTIEHIANQSIGKEDDDDEKEVYENESETKNDRFGHRIKISSTEYSENHILRDLNKVSDHIDTNKLYS